MPLKEMTRLLEETGFSVQKSVHDSFRLRFLDGTAMLNQCFIRYGFMDSWKKIVAENQIDDLFAEIENRLNEESRQPEGLALSIPFVTLDCRK